MPEIGLCTDITCDNEINELYECHCCLRSVCLNHLIQHVEITKENKRRLDSLRNELNTVIITLKLIIEQKLFTIGREQKLIEQGKKFLDMSDSSIDEIQNIFEQINQAIVLNRSEIHVKDEVSFSETRKCSCICKCNKENINSNDQSSCGSTRSKSKSLICLDSAIDTDVVEEFGMSENDRCSTYIDHNSIDITSFDETTKSIKDQDINEEHNKKKRGEYRNLYDRCPLTFDGAYGLTKAKYSIKFCEHGKNRRIGLYHHFMKKHKLKEIYARRLARAVADNQDPMITKLFDENEDVIDHFYKLPCPFRDGHTQLPGYNQKNILNVPCRFHAIPLNTLKYHLRHYHHVSNRISQELIDCFKEIQMKNDVILSEFDQSE
ncbi:unnamed protein product [Rotaria sordida]|uniref:Uncharacterized protein n=1 Tax=Rotaria sordida TaxID=392033 RepID=A0A814QNE3_9BILA|nr:unnamed protein product [Rotaria sordida]CAF1341088.1 unnamed protein product [Rotaria sordida]